jgi:hypothetical protein
MFNELDIAPDKLSQYATLFLTDNKKNINKSHLSKSGKCIHIYYEYLGKEYVLTVPYSGLSSVDMIQYQMDAIYQDGRVLTITQQPGLPYLVSTKDLGCSKLKATNHETDIYHEYKDDEKPYYCSEICDI